MIKYCIFDLDGTLLNTLDTITYYVNRSLEREGLEAASREECRLAVGNGAGELIRRIYMQRKSLSKLQLARVLEDYKKDYNKNALHLTRAYPGVPELIEKLREGGITLAVISNKQDGGVQPVVRKFFGDAFTVVRGGRDGVPLKPAPDAPLAVCREIGAEPCEVAFIGDTQVDINTGKNMGAALTIGVAWGFRDRAELEAAGADNIVVSAEEIISIIQNAECKMQN